MILSFDISSVFSAYLQPGQDWASMTGEERKAQVLGQIPTVQSSVSAVKAQVPKQVDRLVPDNGSGNGGTILGELSGAYLKLNAYGNDAETVKTAVLALQKREQLSQDSSLSAEAREANSQYANVIRQWIGDYSSNMKSAFLEHPELLLDLQHSGYSGERAQSDTTYVLQFLGDMFSDVPKGALNLSGLADLTSEQMLGTLTRFENTLDPLTDQISAACESLTGAPPTGYARPNETPEQLDDRILMNFGKQYGLDPRYNPHGGFSLTTDLTDVPEWMNHMFDSLDVTV